LLFWILHHWKMGLQVNKIKPINAPKMGLQVNKIKPINAPKMGLQVNK